MLAKIFIHRPIAAVVVSIVIVFLGVLSLNKLPIALYPDITPPVVSVSGIYSGANAAVIEETIANPIEDRINGVPGMLYVKSNSTAYGQFSMDVTFETGTDIDIAMLDVQNRVATAMPNLPEDIKRTGLVTKKTSPSILEAVGIYTPNGTYDIPFLDNYNKLYIQKVIARLPGVGDANVLGQNFAMRVWLNPDKMAELGISPGDVQKAIQTQNVQIAAGIVGRTPVPMGQSFEYNVDVKSRLSSKEAFEKIIVSSNEQGALVYLKDIATVELGTEFYLGGSSIRASKASNMLISQMPDANALDVAKNVQKAMQELEKSFPLDLAWDIPYNTTFIVEASIKEVVHTFFEALFLVMLVVFLFLQSWRATLITLLAIPVSVVGTFALFGMLGFSINTITLFAMILAIGIVVDDAIIVVEAVQHHIDRDKLSAKQATIKAMEEISSPVIATALILAAVFVPVAFLPGIVGGLFKQFALTISISVLISAFVALSLTPALCATLMRENPVHAGAKGLYKFFFWFNTQLDKATAVYGKIVKKSLKYLSLSILLLGLIYLFTLFLAKKTPTSFLPTEDQGILMIHVELPPAASSERTYEVLKQAEAILLKNEAIAKFGFRSNVNILLGRTNSSNAGIVFVTLKDWSERAKSNLLGNNAIAYIQKSLSAIKDARFVVFSPPAIAGLGVVDGFSMMIKQTQGSVQELDAVLGKFIDTLNKRPEIARAFTAFSTKYPAIDLSIDYAKAKQLGVDIAEINTALQSFMGGSYVNDFTAYNQSYKVYMQADENFRDKIEKINRFKVRNKHGEMIGLDNFVDYVSSSSPVVIPHYNTLRGVEINGSSAKGYSSGQVIEVLQTLASTVLPDNYSYEFSGTTLQEVKAGNSSVGIFAVSIAFIFLFLAALYESWSVPFAVLGVVPISSFGAFLALYYLGLENSVYAQIGLVTLIGLCAKTSILIVEYCKEKQEKQGMPLVQAVLEASMLRLRPILMTALSFVLGVVSLVVANGAGAAARVNLGWTVLGGMLAVTFLSIFFVPALYVFIYKRSHNKDSNI